MATHANCLSGLSTSLESLLMEETPRLCTLENYDACVAGRTWIQDTLEIGDHVFLIKDY